MRAGRRPDSPWGKAPDRFVWVAQCVCPQRHCILAAAGEADSEAEARHKILAALRDQVAKLVQSLLNPWCGLCGARRETWSYEVERTRWRNMAAAGPALKESERDQALTAAVWRKPDQPSELKSSPPRPLYAVKR